MIQQEIKVATDACLFMGQDRCGRRVVRDGRGMCGARFSDRAVAIRFAMYSSQSRPESVIVLPEGLELDSVFARPFRQSACAPASRRAKRRVPL